MSNSSVVKLLQSPRIRWGLYLLLGALVVFTTIEFALPEVIRGEKTMKDYDAFYVAGRLFWEGRLNDAYSSTTLFEAQSRLMGTNSFMPWTYPPHFNFVTAALALLPVWLGYAVFCGTTLLGYVLLIRRLSQGHQVFVLLLLAPAIFICIRTGQNGFLVGGLLAGFAQMILKADAAAGLPLALLTIKPHFLPGIGVYLLLRRAWKAIAVGALGAAGLLGLATAMFGPAVWEAFLNAAAEARVFLSAGLYPLFRMTSLYAALFTLGLGASAAMTAQLVLGGLWLLGLVLAARRAWPQRHLLALAIMGTLFLSPYAYDYDLPILGVALALLAPDLVARMTLAQFWILLILAWFAGGASAIQSFQTGSVLQSAPIQSQPLSLGVFGLLPLCLAGLALARRTGRAAKVCD